MLLLMSAVEFLDFCTCLALKSLSDRTSNPGLYPVEVLLILVLLLLVIDIKSWPLFRDFCTCLALKSLSGEEKQVCCHCWNPSKGLRYWINLDQVSAVEFLNFATFVPV